MWYKLALTLFWRELRRGELTIIFAAIALAVLTVFSLSSVTERIRLNIEQKSADFIAADRRLASNHPIDLAFLEEAKSVGLNTAQQMFFDSMLFANDELVLGSIKAVSQGYPLRGKVTLKNDFLASEYEVQGVPKLGEVWISEGLFYSLGLSVGDEVEIGAGVFRASKILVSEPDAPFFSLAGNKRVLLNYDDIVTTQAVQPGSRVFYRMLFAGNEQALTDYYGWLKPQLRENQNWQGIKDRQSPLGENLARSESFLLLAGLFGIMLAAVAMAVSAKRYCERQYDPVAMMKTLGGSRHTIRNIFLLHLSMVTLFSLTIGLIIGFVLQSVATDYLASFMNTQLPQAGLKPWVLAISIGVVCALMFSLKPLLDLFDIPPLRVLRRNLGDKLAISKVHMGLSVLTIFSLMWLFSGELKTTLLLFGGTATLMLVLFGLSRLIFRAGRKLGLSPGSSWSLAIATLQKRANANAVQLISFALAIKLMLFLFVLKNDLISDWQMQVPEDAPNAFLININESEVANIASFFAEQKIVHEDIFPIFRGRANGLNGETFARRTSKQEGEEQDDDAREGVGRELNLTWMTELPSSNEVIDGQWFNPDSTELEVSVSKGLAERVDINVGDTLTYLVNERTFDAKVTSIRSVDWGSLKPNFVMIFNPVVAGKFPVTYFTAAKFAVEDAKSVSELLKAHPTISMIDIKSQLEQAQSMIAQVSLAISFVLAIVLTSGALVLISQVQASLAERMQEIVILRTLGAKGRLIKLATLYEFLLLGALAGFVAALVSDITLVIIQRELFDVEGKLHPYIWALGPVSGAAFVAAIGYFMVSSTMRQNTQGLLRKLV
ncbi:ABC transporter permease [Pseudoalteromonas luteoviolacea]|uniref:Cell division protein FtsX n=1 Tax=Pseudoalteromonas luteoviolacea NCIMB 1942 TaxID=1365253 RepID=A0A166Z3N5_9GAMM|nr:FtsX-like permease family protein [Pseudoalteromonas luteoviolacea]KZN43800.1 cell division protein FtsX [Pseudoalteromonas luteoviolacea NCIMB 1942]KZX01491.1 cell division protein FtsX [Pseudoalteromonas luteoviolacea]